MFKNFMPFKFSIENKEAALLIHNKKIVDMYTEDASDEEKKVLMDIEEEAERTTKWVLSISKQKILRNKYGKNTFNARLFLLHKIQSYLLKRYRKEKDTMTAKMRSELDKYIQISILAISEGLGFGG